MKKITLSIFLVLLCSIFSFAGDDPSIQGKLRSNISSSMQKFIAENSITNNLIIYDAVTGELLRLKYDKLHSGILKKGDFYVSCADFNDSRGIKYDIDFLVGETDGSLTTLEAIVHSVGGQKRKYHVEN